MMITVAPEQTESDAEHAGHSAGAEGDLESGSHRTGSCGGRGADVARTASDIPMKPVSPDIKQPARNASVRNRPEEKNESASVPSGLSTAVEVKNTTAISGIRMSAMVLNWRRRYAMAPS